MHYCQNCGAKIESDERFCSLCGYNFGVNSSDVDKDARITELEQKIARLEMRKQVKKARTSNFSPWIAIMSIAFFIIFFGFVLLITLIARG